MPHFKINYESLTKSPLDTVSLLSSLGSPQSDLQSKYKRFYDERKSNCIENLEKVVDATCTYFKHPSDELWVRQLIEDVTEESLFFERFDFYCGMTDKLISASEWCRLF